MEPTAAANPSPTPAQIGDNQNPWQRVRGTVLLDNRVNNDVSSMQARILYPYVYFSWIATKSSCNPGRECVQIGEKGTKDIHLEL
jgi:hypothetical protein